MHIETSGNSSLDSDAELSVYDFLFDDIQDKHGAFVQKSCDEGYAGHEVDAMRNIQARR